MRNRIAAILLAAVMAMGGFGAVHADSQKGGQGGTSGGGSGSGTSSGAGSSGGGSGYTGLFDPLSVEGWNGGAYHDTVGELYCALSDDYGSGVSLILGWDKFGFYLVIIDPDTLKLEPSNKFETIVSVDRLYRAKVDAVAFDTDELELDFGADRKAVNALRKGEKLTLEEWDHFYTLYGTGAAIAAIEDCYNRHR